MTPIVIQGYNDICRELGMNDIHRMVFHIKDCSSSVCVKWAWVNLEKVLVKVHRCRPVEVSLVTKVSLEVHQRSFVITVTTAESLLLARSVILRVQQ
jgi:hypothetical protein